MNRSRSSNASVFGKMCVSIVEEHVRQAVNDVGRGGAARVGHADRHVAVLGHVNCHGRAGGLHAGHRHARVRLRRDGQNAACRWRCSPWRSGASAGSNAGYRPRAVAAWESSVTAVRPVNSRPRDHVGRHLAGRLAGAVLVGVGRRHPQVRVRVGGDRRVAGGGCALDDGPLVAARRALPLVRGRPCDAVGVDSASPSRISPCRGRVVDRVSVPASS